MYGSDVIDRVLLSGYFKARPDDRRGGLFFSHTSRL
jgi:hypothetical protein